ncbi:GTPase Der [Planctomycetes bacterium Pan216]|uniref:GTPase Der n=1 Tax=Kolteria novifilia TaxID=2527975 RepID=A0A518B4Y7_9BACT|nr:GTPase Der [Planctomycetes bacterium Pan216]
MPIPKVVIVGRPNVGKSSLFNWLIGHRVAIVDPTSGVTRDRVDHLTEHGGRYFELVDTGGMGVIDKDGLTDDIEKQIRTAMEEASVILFVVDSQEGITGLDELVARKLRSLKAPLLLVANKADNKSLKLDAETEFPRFGWPMLTVSVTGGQNKVALLETVHKLLPEEIPDEGPVDPSVAMKIAVVGERNVGKSTFINCLAQEERVIVSEVPGTTRDSVDVRFEHQNRAFLAIDTAGVKRKSKLVDSIEFYSLARSQRTIRRADVVLIFFDATKQVTKVEKNLAQYVEEQHKPCVLVINKWDLVKDKDVVTSDYDEYLDEEFPGLTFAPRAFITAQTGKNVHALLDLSQSLFHQAHERITTGELNRLVKRAIEQQAPPVRQNKRPKVFFATQAAVTPPTLVLFCNEPTLFGQTYRRYLLNFIRDACPFPEIPIKLYLRKRESKAEDDLDEGTTMEA